MQEVTRPKNMEVVTICKDCHAYMDTGEQKRTRCATALRKDIARRVMHSPREAHRRPAQMRDYVRINITRPRAHGCIPLRGSRDDHRPGWS